MNEQELRDYFAAAALTGMLSDPGTNTINNEFLAKCSYDLADAMLKERKRDEQ